MLAVYQKEKLSIRVSGVCMNCWEGSGRGTIQVDGRVK